MFQAQGARRILDLLLGRPDVGGRDDSGREPAAVADAAGSSTAVRTRYGAPLRSDAFSVTAQRTALWCPAFLP